MNLFLIFDWVIPFLHLSTFPQTDNSLAPTPRKLRPELKALESSRSFHRIMTSSKKRFPHYWPVNSPHKGQWRVVLIFCFYLRLNKRLGNNRDAGDLRRHRAHYDVTLMGRGIPNRNIIKYVLITGNPKHVPFLLTWINFDKSMVM